MDSGNGLEETREEPVRGNAGEDVEFLDDDDDFEEDSGEESPVDPEDEMELDVDGEFLHRVVARHSERGRRLSRHTARFMGRGRKVQEVLIQPRYYGELLAWALQRYIETEDWRVMRTLGYHYPEPVFIDVDTGRGRIQNVVRDGSLFLEKEGVRLVVTVDANLRTQASVLVTGPAERNEQVVRFAGGIHGILFEQNFYRGKNITLGARINFLDVPRRKWDTIILDPGVKREIKANTLDFLRDCDRLAFYGIPAKRGVLLVGEPGTGKTLVCKALMSISEGVTCIMADAYSLHVGDYISDLYELAQDLAPCIVFIEDIDSISKSRVDFGMVSGPAILTLLAELDGIEEHHRIVTVGTTNYLETIDKAVGQRPSRFDRIIELTRPSLEQRKELVALLCGRITADEDIQDYVARRTDGFTPAQIQEVLFSMVIGNFRQDRDFTEQLEKFGREDVDSAISRVNCRNRHRIGFALGGSNGGHRESTGFEG